MVRHLFPIVLFGAALSAQPDQRIPPAFPSRPIKSVSVAGPLEVRPATADDEAVLAGLSYTKTAYAAPPVDAATFITTYRDRLFAAGWKLIAVPKVDVAPLPEGVLDIAAHDMSNDRNIYTRISRSPDGSYDISVADIGAEDWAARLSKDCRLPVHSLHFDLDRPTLRAFESTPTLEKLANLLKAKSAPPVEVQGHMDNVGEAGADARQTLSELRAKTVASWLTSHGVAATTIIAKGYGKTKPIADNDTDLGRALNRRIEIACLRD